MTKAAESFTKEERIKKEYARLNRLFTKVPQNSKKVVSELIQNAAFMGITLQDLQEQINETGTTDTYQNGENQYGTKVNPDVTTYNTMVKNYAAIIRQLTDLLPKNEAPKNDSFQEFINGRIR